MYKEKETGSLKSIIIMREQERKEGTYETRRVYKVLDGEKE